MVYIDSIGILDTKSMDLWNQKICAGGSTGVASGVPTANTLQYFKHVLLKERQGYT